MSRARPLLAAAVLLAVVIGMRAAGSPADAKTAQLPDDDARDEAASDSWDTDGDGGGALGAAEGEWEEEGEKMFFGKLHAPLKRNTWNTFSVRSISALHGRGRCDSAPEPRAAGR